MKSIEDFFFSEKTLITTLVVAVLWSGRFSVMVFNSWRVHEIDGYSALCYGASSTLLCGWLLFFLLLVLHSEPLETPAQAPDYPPAAPSTPQSKTKYVIPVISI